MKMNDRKILSSMHSTLEEKKKKKRKESPYYSAVLIIEGIQQKEPTLG